MDELRDSPGPGGRRVATSPLCVSAAAAPAATVPRPRQKIAVRGFGDFGATLFSAADTFDATLGSSRGCSLAEAAKSSCRRGSSSTCACRTFPEIRGTCVRRRRRRGVPARHRHEGRHHAHRGLGRLSLSAARPHAEHDAVRRRRHRLAPVFGDLGFRRTAARTSARRFTGYHALGGVEYRMRRLFALAGEAQWTTVPDAFGSGLRSAAEVFDERNLGGISFRVRFVIGR